CHRPVADNTRGSSTPPGGEDSRAGDDFRSSHRQRVTSEVLRSQDTIVAVASAVGRGAIALVRLSGPEAFAIAAKHLRELPKEPRVAHLSAVFDGDRKLDEALVTLFPAPNSFTGEDTVELSTHGGYFV